MRITNPAFNYDQHGHRYSAYRRTDPRIAAYVHEALGDAKTVLNVGAGAGSYEPEDRYVVAIEPSAVMRLQRLRQGKAPAIIGKADSLPFDGNAFDASMAMVTVHHWPDVRRGLQELRRVTKDRVIVMTADPDALDLYWTKEYFPELIEVERQRYPKIEVIKEALGNNCQVISIPVHLDCVDGFQEAFYGRPEAFLEKEVRQAQSAWGFLDSGMEDVLVKRLADDLASGVWDEKYSHYRTQPTFTGCIMLIVGMP